MKVQEFMTATPVTIDEDATLKTALHTMDEHAIRHLPVVEGEHLIGMISDGDLVGAAGWRGGKPEAESAPHWVRDVMHRDVVTVNPSDDAAAAATEVFVRHVGCLPVIENGKLLGIISEVDLVRLVADSDRIDSSDEATIGGLGGQQAVVVTPDATLAQISDLMYAKSIRHVPVAEGGKLLGIVSDRDMRRADARRADGGASDWSIEARKFMTEGVVTVDEDLPVSQAAAVMVERGIGALVVTRKSGGPGIVTTSDMLGYLLDLSSKP